METRKSQCRLEIYDMETATRQVVAKFDQVVEAPNWTQDGKALIYNSGGQMYRFDLEAQSSTLIDTGFAQRCNNDHVLSPDGRLLAISHEGTTSEGAPDEGTASRIYVLPLAGGLPRCVTQKGPSYLHGWAPDGNTLVYCGYRDGQYHIYTIHVDGGSEHQLTAGPGMEDGPEYSPDGSKIWFNSTRSGLMQIWCMNADGSMPAQMSQTDMNCWFPHVSPNGRHVVYIAYRKGDLLPQEHLPDKAVQIRMMDTTGKNDQPVVELMGGQGSMNVNAWAPDSKRFAFVSY